MKVITPHRGVLLLLTILAIAVFTIMLPNPQDK